MNDFSECMTARRKVHPENTLGDNLETRGKNPLGVTDKSHIDVQTRRATQEFGAANFSINFLGSLVNYFRGVSGQETRYLSALEVSCNLRDTAIFKKNEIDILSKSSKKNLNLTKIKSTFEDLVGITAKFSGQLSVLENPTIMTINPFNTNLVVECKNFRTGVFLSEDNCYLVMKRLSEEKERAIARVQINNTKLG